LIPRFKVKASTIFYKKTSIRSRLKGTDCPQFL
jgi:hypothetical protein